RAGPRSAHDVIVSAVPATARATVAVVTSAGRLIKLGVLELPALPPSAHSPCLAGGAPVGEFVPLPRGETVVGLATVQPSGGGLARGAARHAGGHGQGEPVRRVPAEGAGHRRGALPPLPARRGPARAGLGGRRAGAGRDRGGHGGGSAPGRRAPGRFRRPRRA